MLDVARPSWTLPRWAVIRDARRRQRRRHRRVLVTITAAVVAAAVGWQIVGRAQSPAPAASSPGGGGSVRRVPIAGTLLDTTTMRGNLWVLTCRRFRERGATCSTGYLTAIRAASGRVLRRTGVADPTALASDRGAIWIAHLNTDEVTRVDARTARVTATIHLRLPHPVTSTGWRRFVPSGISADNRQITVSSGLGYLAEIDPRTARVNAILSTDSEATSTTRTEGLTWFADELDGVGALRPDGTRVNPYSIAWRGQPLDVGVIAYGNGLIWALGSESSLANTAETTVVSTVDPKTGRIAHQWPVGSTRTLPTTKTATYVNQSSTMLVTNNATYVDDGGARQLLRLTPPGQTRRLPIPGITGLVAATRLAIWATDSRGELLRISLGPH